MKTIYLLIGLIFMSLLSCKKEMPVSKSISDGISNDAQTDGPVNKPLLVLASTTKSQFIANANGNQYSEFTVNFSAKEAGITIQSLTFLANETDSNDALSVSIGEFGFPGFFNPTAFYAPAKASTHIDGTNIILPDDGSPVPVTFRVMYRTPSSETTIQSGDTVSIQISGLEYTNTTSPYLLFENTSSKPAPEIMITGAKPALEISAGAEVLHRGITKILTVKYSSVGGSVGINNLPLVIDATGTNFLRNLIVRDENNHIVNTSTINNGNKYTIQFPEGYILNGESAHTFSIYASVYKIRSQASLTTRLQKRSDFSWTDVAGGRTTAYTDENATYFHNYPTTIITTHN
ncbi:MAG: hypothetical protein ABI405_06020 [Parafilimonas sp.]